MQVFLDPLVSTSGIAARTMAVLEQPIVYLGAVTTDAQGRLESELSLPGEVLPGDRVLQLIGQTASGEEVVLTIGITVEEDVKDAPTIMIAGSRGEGRDARRIYVTGSTTGLSGQIVRPSVRMPGQEFYELGNARRVIQEDGTFAWRRTSGKKTYVYFSTESGIRSKAIAIEAKARR